MNLLGALYGRVAAMRRAWYARDPDRVRQLARPVISVGNLVTGGSGKTPVVAALAGRLASAGERPSILSRGYGRREGADGVVVVSDAAHVLATPEQGGDEPCMLARKLPGVPVLVSADRYLAGQLAERTFGCTVHLLDDGFQHVQLGRDIDLLVVSKADLDERLLPFGALREPLAAARAAHAVLVPGREEDAAAVQSALGIDDVFRVTPRYGPPRLVHPFGAPVPQPYGIRVVAVAGIARPRRFFDALRQLGYEVVRELAFRDHRWFTSRDLASIKQAAIETRADAIMTTEKDAVRLAVGDPWRFLPLEVTIEPEDRFAAWLAGRLAAAHRRRVAA